MFKGKDSKERGCHCVMTAIRIKQEHGKTGRETTTPTTHQVDNKRQRPERKRARGSPVKVTLPQKTRTLVPGHTLLGVVYPRE